MKAYLFLAAAILAEVVATSALKACDEFTRLVPTLLVGVGYLISFYFLTMVLKILPVGITYSIWSGVGIVLVTIVSLYLYGEVPDLPAIIGMGLIIAGVVVINVFSDNVPH